MVTKEQVLRALEEVFDPQLHRSLVELGGAGRIEDYAGEAFVVIARQVVDRASGARRPATPRP